MKFISRFLLFCISFLALTIGVFVYKIPNAKGQVPGLKTPPCDDTGDPEFQSLRPYQTSPCGGAPKAYYCSNDLVFVETFNMAYKGGCQETLSGPGDAEFSCDPQFHVNKHDLYVELDDSMFPIMGNTEEVKNSQSSAETYDDAVKVNEYVSWYLSGVNNRAEYGEPTDDQTVNYSGPLKKLLPASIQELQRAHIVDSFADPTSYLDDDTGDEITEKQNHNQIVACASPQYSILGLIRIGKYVAHECYDGNGSPAKERVFRLSDWIGHLPPQPFDEKYIGNTELYKKDRCDWQGGSYKTLTIPFTKISASFCIDNPLNPNYYSDLYQYIPLANNSDKKGAEMILGDGPSYTGGAGTTVENGQHDGFWGAALWFAHTQEAFDLSALLNKMHTPEGVEATDVPNTTEFNNCSALKVRTNKGDNLFPGDNLELQVKQVEYDITEVDCFEHYEVHPCVANKNQPDCTESIIHTLKCPAYVELKIKTATKTPYAEEVYKQTVTDSNSAFRRIYPKVEAGAPVSCIADIPTVTSVTYDPSKSQPPNEGEQSFKVRKRPKDSSGESPELTFPHIGSVYEYFLQGIQTALRPKGYGEQPVSGNCVTCGELPELPHAGGSCVMPAINSTVGNLPPSLIRIIEAAAETYQTPPNLILGIMYGEGLFDGNNKKDWTEENVKNWATCTKVPDCNDGEGDDGFLGFYSNVWPEIAKNIAPDIQKLGMMDGEPSRCNLIQAIYGLSWNLHDSADGGFPYTCFGISMQATIPTSCNWDDKQLISAIKIAENGYEQGCFTLENSCATGGGNEALCPGRGDNCERVDHLYANPSHMRCVYDIAKQ